MGRPQYLALDGCRLPLSLLRLILVITNSLSHDAGRVFCSGEGSALLGQDGLPFGTSWPYSHLFYEHPEDSVERNIPGRQMGIADFSASYLRSLLEMQMRCCDWAVADRVPMVK